MPMNKPKNTSKYVYNCLVMFKKVYIIYDTTPLIIVVA